MTDNCFRRQGWHVADRVGATASLLCAVHCAALPFVLALLPLIGLGFLAGHLFERIFVLCAVALASVAVIHGYRRHRRRLPLLLAGPGLVLLAVGVCVDVDTAVTAHTVMVVIGGSLVASAHLCNLRCSHLVAGAATGAQATSAAGHCYADPGVPVAVLGPDAGHGS